LGFAELELVEDDHEFLTAVAADPVVAADDVPPPRKK